MKEMGLIFSKEVKNEEISQEPFQEREGLHVH